METNESQCYHVCSTDASTVTVGTQLSGTHLASVNLSICDQSISGIGANSSICDSTASTQSKSKAQSNSGNYVNIVPMPVGVQYHQQRRKYSSQMQPDYQSSRMYYGGNGGDYVSRERCREDYYTLASTPVPLSDVESIGNALMPTHSNSSVSSPLPIAVQQQQHQQQPNSSLQQSNVSSVLYTVQRVITTSQIQTSGALVAGNISNISDSRNAQEMLECNGNTGSNVCSNTTNYQIHTQQMPSTSETAQLQPNQPSNGVVNNQIALTRPLQNVIPTCVYLMSRVAVHMEIEETNQCPAQVILAAALGCEELGISNKLLAQSVFSLWMTSPLLEIQLKSQNRPFSVRLAWTKLLNKFSSGNALQKKIDEPMIQLKRNVFLAKRDEEKIKDPRIIEMLYEEARHNVLNGRYVLEPAHSIMLAGIQARIELGPYNVHSHTLEFFRENQFRFLPQAVAKNGNWSWMPVNRKTSAEVKLLEQFKRVPTTATTRKLMRKYLEFCWALPFYGAAFFHAQIEQPARGLMSLFSARDVDVLVGINERGIFVIDQNNNTLLLGLKYEEFSWDFARPSTSEDATCLPCIFLQFDAMENGMNVSKLMQIFSKQAPMMDALISHFADQMRRRREGDNGQQPEPVTDEPNPIQSSGNGVLSNKLSRLTLATYDDDGHCIGQMGSLSISY